MLFTVAFWSCLALGRIDHSAHKHKAVCAVLVDQEEEGVVHSKADLGGKGHEAHLGQGGSLCALLIHSDGPLVLQLGARPENLLECKV